MGIGSGFNSLLLAASAVTGNQAGSPEVSGPEYWVALFTAILAVAAVLQLGLFFWQLRLMRRGIQDSTVAAHAAKHSADAAKKSADISEEAMIVGARAFVFATGIYTDCFPQDDGSYNWKLRPTWTNTGKTPTKNLSLYVDYCISDKELQKKEIDFTNLSVSPGSGHMAPRQTMHGGQIPRDFYLTPDFVEEILDGKKFLYMWGWVKYSDVFADSKEHITRFCWRILPVGFPRTFKLGSNKLEEILQFNYVIHYDGNCADDECYPE